MINYKFSIDNKDFFIPDNYLSISHFTVKSSPRDYELLIDKEYLIETIREIMDNNDKNVLVVDRNVFELYLKELKYNIFIIDAIEENKNIDTALKLISYLENIGFTKQENLVVVGGGIVQDICAFVGAVYKRGINWIFFPSTVLAMCDSCIGGKAGLNYKDVKNQIALFSSPYKIYINTSFIKTLDENAIRSGLGEIFKLCIIGGYHFVDLYNSIVKNGKVLNIEDYLTLILTALYIKKEVIEYDEFEKHIRKSLNYGHTLGHAIETMSNYKIPHGQAVSMGMIMVNELASKYGFFDKEKCKQINNDLLKIIDKKDLEMLDIEKSLELIKKDKKVQGDILTLVCIQEPGITKFINIKINNDLFCDIQLVLKNILISI